jgi:succinyl-diaminopimelate desuccinylase
MGGYHEQVVHLHIPGVVVGGTVAAHFRRKGFPVAVWSRIHETAHQPNEYTDIPFIIGDAKVFAHVFLGA